MGALKNEYAVVLWYLRSRKTRRFYTKFNATLHAMETEECLLDRYTPRYAVPAHTFYKVPRYVWRRIDKREPDAVPPWLNDIHPS
jgi:hypothetical protein